jgi:lactoylglutathione lyase
MELGGTVIYVDDVPTALDFYRRAFALEASFVDLDVQLPGTDPSQTYQFAQLATAAEGGALQLATHALGALLMPGYQRPANGQTAGVEVAFYTDDVRGAFDRAVEAGAAVLAEPTKMPWGQTAAYVKSIDGTFVGLCTRMPEAPAGD